MSGRIQGELVMDKATATKPATVVDADKLTVARPPDDLLFWIQQVVGNPEISVEKMQALRDMQVQMEDRRAEKEFDAALIDAQADVQMLKWDKVNTEKNSHSVSYPKIDRMLRPVRIKHGFTQSWDTELGPTPEIALLCCDLIHKGGHRRRYRTPMPIDGQGPKGGGVMTKPQAVNAGTSYGMRNLAKMIWNIPMLVDKDDTDGNDPKAIAVITEAQVKELDALIVELAANKAAFLKTMQVEKLEDIRVTEFQRAKGALEARRGVVINATKVADLRALLEEVKVQEIALTKELRVSRIEDIKVGDYTKAVKWVEGKRK